MTNKSNINDYTTLSEWYSENSKYYPVQIPAAIQRLMKSKGITFHEAYQILVENKSIIELNNNQK